MYNDFNEMWDYYTRRNIFNEHDRQLIVQEIVHNSDTFFAKIVRPKWFLGRLNYGDVMRISAIIG